MPTFSHWAFQLARLRPGIRVPFNSDMFT